MHPQSAKPEWRPVLTLIQVERLDSDTIICLTAGRGPQLVVDQGMTKLHLLDLAYRFVDWLSRSGSHKQALEQSIAALTAAETCVTARGSAEFIAHHLTEASQALGEIVGEVTTDDLLGQIFSKFCIGK